MAMDHAGVDCLRANARSDERAARDDRGRSVRKLRPPMSTRRASRRELEALLGAGVGLGVESALPGREEPAGESGNVRHGDDPGTARRGFRGVHVRGRFEVKAIVVLVAGCTPTFTDHFLEVTAVRSVPSLAGKRIDALQGTSCKSVCTTKREYDGIDYCNVAMFDVKPRFVCRIHHQRSSPEGVNSDWLVDIPTSVDLRTLPEKGDVPIAMCEAAGCQKRFDSDSNKDVITACSVYPYRPDKTEPYL